tara:strand:- start:2115 stop:2534 length:420 start_codon:yes stop_codon:yes gene_type:complete
MKICIVCYANYCRSPVAEHLFKNKFPIQHIFFSRGLSPKTSSNMDPRSQKYLENVGIKKIMHFPKKITLNDLKESDLILALDPLILNDLNLKFPSYRFKIKSMNFMCPKIILQDPYTLNDEGYVSVMRKITEVCEKTEF